MMNKVRECLHMLLNMCKYINMFKLSMLFTYSHGHHSNVMQPHFSVPGLRPFSWIRSLIFRAVLWGQDYYYLYFIVDRIKAQRIAMTFPCPNELIGVKGFMTRKTKGRHSRAPLTEWARTDPPRLTVEETGEVGEQSHPSRRRGQQSRNRELYYIIQESLAIRVCQKTLNGLHTCWDFWFC